MRGAYAAGALSGLYEAGARFDEVYATSSGAASAAYLIAGQPEGLAIWKDHLHGHRLVHRGKFLLGLQALDLHYLVDEVFHRRIPLDTRRLAAAGVPLWVPTTDIRTGEVRYWDLAHAKDPWALLRAAMSLPGAALESVEIEGAQYVDGGVVDQVPIERALEDGPIGALTVVLTRSERHVAKPTSRLGLFLATRRFPGIRDALLGRHVVYARALRSIELLAKRIPVRVIRPEGGLPVSRWTTKRDRLLAAIEQGARDAERVLSPPRPAPA